MIRPTLSLRGKRNTNLTGDGSARRAAIADELQDVLTRGRVPARLSNTRAATFAAEARLLAALAIGNTPMLASVILQSWWPYLALPLAVLAGLASGARRA